MLIDALPRWCQHTELIFRALEMFSTGSASRRTKTAVLPTSTIPTSPNTPSVDMALFGTHFMVAPVKAGRVATFLTNSSFGDVSAKYCKIAGEYCKFERFTGRNPAKNS
jgi:hypothetical protein